MGEQEESVKPEEKLTSFPSFYKPSVQLKWLDNVDLAMAMKSDCPLYSQAMVISKQMREIIEGMLQCEFQKARIGFEHGAITEGDREVTLSYASLIDPSAGKQLDEIEKRETELFVQRSAKIGVLEMFLNKVLSWEHQSKPTQRSPKFALKYYKNTFAYGMKTVESPTKGNMAKFCAYFYDKCTASGKIAFSDALADMQKIVPGTTDAALRQWINDFNRWARRPANFGTQLGRKGWLLRVRERDIVRIK